MCRTRSEGHEPMVNSIGNRNIQAYNSNMYLTNNTDRQQMDMRGRQTCGWGCGLGWSWGGQADM